MKLKKAMGYGATLKILYTIMTLYILIAIIIPYNEVSGEITGTMDTFMEFPEQYVPVNLYLAKGMELTAEPFMDDDKQDMYITCPDGYVGSGLFGYGFIHAIGRVYWQKVGKWESEPLRGGLKINPPIRYTIFVTARDVSTYNAKFAFTLLINGKPYNGNPDPENWTAKATNVDIPAGQIVRVTAIDESFNLTTYLQEIKPGDRIGVEIWCYLQGNVQLIYGSKIHPSQMTLVSNAIRFKKLKLTQTTATATFYDSFSVSPYKMKSGFEIDGAEYMTKPEVIIDCEGTQGLRWTLPERITPGTHVLRVMLAYDPEANQTFEATKNIYVKAQQTNVLSTYIPLIILMIIIPILVGVGVFVWYYRDRKLERYLQEHPEILEELIEESAEDVV